jgi:hypothetical protein
VVRAFVAGAFVSPSSGRDSAVVAVGEATFGGVTAARPILTAGEVDIEFIVVDQRGSARQAVAMLVFIGGREAPMLVALIVAIAPYVLAVAVQVIAG